MFDHDSSPVPIYTPDAIHWVLKPFAPGEISNSDPMCWLVAGEDDTRRRQVLWYLFFQYRHRYDAAVLVSVNEDTIAYFEAHCPGILVCRFEMLVPMPDTDYQIADNLCKKIIKLTRPYVKKNVAVIWEDTPSQDCFTFPLNAFCRSPWSSPEPTFTCYYGTRSYQPVYRGMDVDNRVILPTTLEPGRSMLHTVIPIMRRRNRLEPMTPAGIDSYLESVAADSSLVHALVFPFGEDEPVSMISLADDGHDHQGCSFDFLM